MDPRTRWDGGKAAIYADTFAHMCAGAIPHILSHALPPESAPRLFDAGCGTGLLMRAAADRGYQVMGCDGDAHMCHIARAGTREQGRARIWHSTLPTLAELPSKRIIGEIDTVTCAFVLQHVGKTAEQRAAMTALARLARPGGRIITAVWAPGFTPHRTPVLEVIDEIDPRPSGRSSKALPAPQLSQLATQVGLRVLTAHEVCWQWQISFADYWRGIEAGIAHLGQRYISTPPNVRARITTAATRALAPWGAPGILRLPCRAYLCVAEKSATPDTA